MRIKVLLVDDELEFVEMLSERLAARGFSVSKAWDGRQALLRLSEVGPDVVVLDVQMPGMDGLTVLREIRQTSPLTEVLMLTGHATVESAVEGIRAGAYDFILKPAEMRDLVGKIVAAYTRKSGREENIRAAGIEQIMLRRGWD